MNLLISHSSQISQWRPCSTPVSSQLIPQSPLEVMENSVTGCYFNSTVLESVSFLLFAYFPAGGLLSSLGWSQDSKAGLKYNEAESNISLSSRSILSRTAEMEAGLAVFSRNFQRQPPTGSSLRDDSQQGAPTLLLCPVAYL